MLNKFRNLFKPNEVKKEYKLVLSLDGGGVRGLATVIFLKELEKASGKKIVDLFDFFIGTSVGGLNAMHLAVNEIEVSELESFWSQDNLAMSMQSSFWTKNFFLKTKPIYNNKSKTELLEKYFGNKLISESKKPIAVLAYDVENRKPRVLTSYTDQAIKATSAINATSAAPLYYPTVKIEDGSWLIDGSVVSNNPCLIGYNEARKYFKTDNIKVFSVGTGRHLNNLDGEDSSKWGPFGWLTNDILGILLESHADHEILNDLIGKNYLRINSIAENINWNLDDYTVDNLRNIRNMGLDWWNLNNKKVIDFLSL
ncbi:MAG: patatin-like phospholipase family protein [Pelagibacterales bacterium]|nr:patatin-like phospholipase family protein [Pelagibacterales bacterium]MBL6861410.1 patatin-like phospholipase family protein [Pelagibacterales bacterium]